MELNGLKEILKKELSFRYKQVEKAIFQDFISNWSEATNLPKKLRDELNEKCSLEIVAEVFVSKKNTKKTLITLSDGLKIESVLMQHKDGRNTVCVSCQVGCPMACDFCATGSLGFKRNLSSDEMLLQVIFFERLLQKQQNKERVTNVVFMGMGEPMLNLENILKAIDSLNDKNKFNIGARKISISTVGIVDGIKKIAKYDKQINLAISLHAANDKIRTSFIKTGKGNNIEKILKAVDYYIEKTGRKVMFEYLMIDGVNDSEKSANELAVLLKKPLYMINLIPYNVTFDKFKPSSKEKIEKFKNILIKYGIETTQRESYGGDIGGACGQLAGKK